MSHPDNSQQIDLIRQYVADVEAEVNCIGVIPRDKFLYSFDSIAFEMLSKAFALSKAAISLLDSKFPDEAYGLIRSLVEIVLNLRYLTEDMKKLDELTELFKTQEKLEKQVWLAFALEQFKGKPEEAAIQDYAKQLEITPNKASNNKESLDRFVRLCAGDNDLESSS